jgi:diguanylate cyclase (GGDEF)-like protein
MQRPAKPDNEAERLAALHRYDILDSGAEQRYDDLVRVAAAICGTPMGSVSLIDADRQWFKAKLGLQDDDTPRDTAFCAHAILQPDAPTIVEDASLDPRFHDNPLVLGGPGIRFYAGAPLLGIEGLPLGTLCVMDRQPRRLEPYQREALEALSRQVSALLELRRVTRDLRLQLQDRDWYEQRLQAFSSSLEEENADLAEQLRLDSLTGLANRRALIAALDAALATDACFCVALADIDHFKAINDTHGHGVGDTVLARVADNLRDAGGDLGILARHGGEEFAWLLQDMTPEQAMQRCEAMRAAVAGGSDVLPATISIGVACRTPGDDHGSLLQRADQALYAAKHAGRNRVVRG